MPDHASAPDQPVDEIVSRVVADWSDDRDADFVPASGGEPPGAAMVDDYRALADEAWHQRGEECTGFALAAVANYLIRKRQGDPGAPSVSRRMLYEMAQRYDGEKHNEGSTLRGALKGWSRVGVAGDDQWPYDPDDEHGAVHGRLTLGRILDGRKRPLLRYRRVAGQRVDAMKHALTEGHPLYVAARTHVGWYRLFLSDAGSVIERRLPDDSARGIHAFVIVGYDEQGFWIHNSWGPEWGHDGYAVLPFDQWKWGATDAWVVDAGIEPARDAVLSTPAEPDPATAKRTYRDMWPHLVVLRDDGQLASSGLYEMDEGSVKTMLYLFDEYTKMHEWHDRKLAVVADGGDFSPASTVERLRPLRDRMLEEHIYPIFLVWETAWFGDIEHELQTWADHDNMSESDAMASEATDKVVAASPSARAAWTAIGDRSRAAVTTPSGGARLLANSIAYKRNQRFFDLHVVSFGAGDELLAPLTTILCTPVNGAVAIAPTTTIDGFRSTYGEMLADGCLQHMTVATLDPLAEQADRFGHTDSSLLALVSDVWAPDGRVMRRAARAARQFGEWTAASVPLLGLGRCLADDETIHQFCASGRLDLAPIEDSRHVDLQTEPGLRELVISEILADREVVSAQAPSDHTGLPRDPLARAEALQRRA